MVTKKFKLMAGYKGRYVEIPDPNDVGSSFRKATKEELDQSKFIYGQIETFRRERNKINDIIAQLEKDCPHTVFYDEEGFAYDMRWCAACNKSLGFI